jgi:hypothetical protein
MKLILLTAFIFCHWACKEKIASPEKQFATDEVEGRSLQV